MPIVLEILVVGVTSAPVERVFSTERAVVTYKRSCLTTQSLEVLVEGKEDEVVQQRRHKFYGHKIIVLSYFLSIN